jgi:flagellar M-ring protein FliF
MPPQLLARLKGITETLAKVSLGQKVLIAIGVAALALGGTAFATWATKPTYAPLFNNLAADDASAITTQLTADKVPFQLADGGTSILVPQADVDAERLKAGAAGLPSSAKTGYALLDAQGITSSQFQQKVTYQRALEGELAKTIESIDGVNTAVVHLAIPEESVFTDTTSKPTASVLLDLGAGTTLTNDQVQSVLHLVSSSVPGMDSDQVTITDNKGELLSSAGTGLTGTGAGDSQTQAYNQRTQASLQAVLDKVVGPGKAVASVSADLNYDQTKRTTETFSNPNSTPPLSESTTKETYDGSASGVGGALGSNGVLGMDGESAGTDTGTSTGSGGYTKESDTVNNADDKVTEQTTVAPGTVRRMSVAVVVDAKAADKIGVQQLTDMVTAAAGIDTTRGDTLSVTPATFDNSASKAAAKELAAANAAKAKAAQRNLMIQGAIGALVLLVLLIAFIAWRRAAKKRRRTPVDLGELERLYPPTGPLVDPDGALALPESTGPVLTPAAPDPAALRRAEVGDIVDAQPAEVAELLRGWLTETKKG